jgi:hypothetical protein
MENFKFQLNPKQTQRVHALPPEELQFDLIQTGSSAAMSHTM